MFESGMKRVGLAYLFSYLFYAGGGNVATICCRFNTLGIFFGDIVDDTVIRQGQYQPFFENFVNFVTCQLYRSDGFGLAAGFLL
jgi:hypothetical protein